MRSLLHAILTRFVTVGRLTVRFPDGRLAVYGPGGQPAAGASIGSWRTVRGLLTNPALVFGEAYVSGDIQPLDCKLEDILDLLFGNLEVGGQHPGLALRRLIARAMRQASQYNPIPTARRNVAHHYDLSGHLYSLFLDRDRNYSCAYFAHGGETLEEAQAEKKRHIAQKLCLTRPGLHVLDIGSGWGGMAITLAQDYGARVTGITLSTEQLVEARARAEAAGVSDRVTFELQDYRTIGGTYDRIVSVGMFEHVGVTHYAQFFRTIRGLLDEDGVALIHAIGRSDGPSVTNPWITRHIFPGGYSPALSEVFRAVERERLIATDVEILRLHYAETIRHWRRRFEANRDAIAALYDTKFTRLFELYLAGSEYSFRHLNHMVWQLQLARHQAATPLTRGYMEESTAFLKKSSKKLSLVGRPDGQEVHLRTQKLFGSFSRKRTASLC
jgi:cyclopropane-fatty-acyl-phospholipid synthase